MLNSVYDFSRGFFFKNKLQMTKKSVKKSFAFILTIKINKSKLNFPFGVKMQSCKLVFKSALVSFLGRGSCLHLH